ncbi:inner centromere protein A isoform X4 [Stomoxys calcitrans]|uniref:inner centromere protein A isoform X4 n=1 Tax=Stomoxys calcitrans TaxID=35570 RepID=UPI0027E3104A|nr:inner centromere protein A isoform X4 [Stomoxys calcitrans]
MASLGGEHEISTNDLPAETTKRTESREGSVERKAAKERDDKLKVARERQNEERQRKIEELKAQAEAAQRYREQKEEERRRRIDEIRQRDSEKRTQVEERKKAIMEAEKERREYIQRKNMERESRIEVKKRERNSIGYAFGSSTPRLLEPADFGMVSPSTFWGQRRSTSISNVAGASLSRRSSERELNDCGSKKRATSASGTDRHEDHHRRSRTSMYEVFNWGYINDEPPKRFSLSIVGSEINIDGPPLPAAPITTSTTANATTNVISNTKNTTNTENSHHNNHHYRQYSNHNNFYTSAKEDNVDASHIVFRSVARRKTDLMPTIPSPRDGHYGSRSSLSNTPSRTPGSRSGTVTPGGHTTSRPGSAMSTSTTMSTSGFINRRSMPAARKPRPASIAGTVVSVDEINKLKKENKPPVKNVSLSPSTSAQTTPKRSTNMMSTSLIVTSSSSRLFSAEKKTPIKREPLTPKVSTPKPLSKTASSDRLHKLSKEKSKDIMSKSAITPPIKQTMSSNGKDHQNAATKSKEQKEALNQVKTEESLTKTTPPQPPAEVKQNGGEGGEVESKKHSDNDDGIKESSLVEVSPQHEEKADEGTEKEPDTESESTSIASVPQKPKSRSGSKEGSMVRDLPPAPLVDNNDAMTASMMAKSKITTEEEAKAALAERRRLAREEAERQAELERQRLEAERLAELKRQEEEAERQRQFEEEAMRLAEEQRKAEEERLRQAIEEAKQREEEERQKREDEEKQRIEREEAEKKAKEEAEKQKIEVAERLKREEKEREERRKRVEAIMSRTRRGGAATNTPNSTPTKENNNSPKPIDAVATPTGETNPVEAEAQHLTPNSNNISDTNISSESTTPIIPTNSEVINSSNDNSGPTSGSSTTSITPSTPATASQPETQSQIQQSTPVIAANIANTTTTEPQNTQAMYEQSVIDKENSLINSFSNMIIDENVKNIQQNLQQQQQIQAQIVAEETNGKQIFVELQNNDTNTTTPQSVANGNGHHIESINNKNDIDLLQTVVPSTNQLIDLSLEPQDTVNFNNNNSLITTTTTTLVTADSHENKDISLL